MNILITGSSGFIGKNICSNLSTNPKFNLTAAYRSNKPIDASNIVKIANLDANTNWAACLIGQDVVIHTAARVHIMNDDALDLLSEYRSVNVDGTINLAMQAAQAGVKRFIFISSIKVIGDKTIPGKPFLFDDEPNPEDAYGMSKLEAELGLKQIASESGMQFVIIRPPLVYGPGVKGNFSSLLSLTMRRWPLPLGSLNNKRSMVSSQNLVDLIVTCIDHPSAANQVFLVSDGDDFSTSDLLRRLGNVVHRPVRLLNIPVVFLRFFARLLGKGAAINRLTGSLQVDIAHTKEVLGWTPPYTVDEGLNSCFIKSDS